jgi:ribonuclease HII
MSSFSQRDGSNCYTIDMLSVGIDEVGRGCWAGPVVAGAVLLGAPIPGLKDSKKLSKKLRSRYSATIRLEAQAYGLGWVWPEEIDNIGLTAAVGLAMHRALEDIQEEYDEVIIDGDFNFFPENSKASTLIRADNLIPAVSAASIIAKVARDRYMEELAISCPDYGFEKHVGYGTALHLEKLKLHGVTSFHRQTYKPIMALLQ